MRSFPSKLSSGAAPSRSQILWQSQPSAFEFFSRTLIQTAASQFFFILRSTWCPLESALWCFRRQRIKLGTILGFRNAPAVAFQTREVAFSTQRDRCPSRRHSCYGAQDEILLHGVYNSVRIGRPKFLESC